LIFQDAASAVKKEDPPKKVDEESSLQDFGRYLLQVVPKFIQKADIHHGQLTLMTSPDHIVPLMT